MRRSSAVRVGTVLLLASAWLASCSPKTAAPVAPPPVGVPPPPTREELQALKKTYGVPKSKR